MASVTDICNLALGMVGDEANVSSISPVEESTQAEHCARFYPIARDAMLSLVEPRWAIKRVNLALLDLADVQPDTWGFAYSYPNGVKVLSVGLPEATLVDAERQAWDSEALANGSVVIYTNVEQGFARIIDRVTDTTKFGPLFVIATARLLASFLAGPIVKGMEGMKVAMSLRQQFDKIELPQAISENARALAHASQRYRDFVPSSLQARS